jgi:hypothetical protein
MFCPHGRFVPKDVLSTDVLSPDVLSPDVLSGHLNIFAITELTITTLFCLNVKGVKSDVLKRTSLPFQRAESL